MKVIGEWRALSAEQLAARLRELQKELLKLNAGIATGVNPANPGKVRQTKKNIARLHTIAREKELTVRPPEASPPEPRKQRNKKLNKKGGSVI